MKDNLFCVFPKYKLREVVNTEENFSSELLIYILKLSLLKNYTFNDDKLSIYYILALLNSESDANRSFNIF